MLKGTGCRGGELKSKIAKNFNGEEMERKLGTGVMSRALTAGKINRRKQSEEEKEMARNLQGSVAAIDGVLQGLGAGGCIEF